MELLRALDLFGGGGNTAVALMVGVIVLILHRTRRRP